jgi:hypothetical protein
LIADSEPVRCENPSIARSPELPRKLSIEERARLVMELMNLYGSDAQFAGELEQLGTLADPLPRLDTDLRQDPSVEERAYLERLDHLDRRYGLHLLPKVAVGDDPMGFPMFQPSGQDFLQGWCLKRRGPRPLPPERLGEAAGYWGSTPTIGVRLDLEWEPTRESRGDLRRRVDRLVAEQIDGGLSQLRKHGYAFGGRRPSKRFSVHLRWLFEIRKRAKARGELSQHGRKDPDEGKVEVVKAVTALADSIGIAIRERGVH